MKQSGRSEGKNANSHLQAGNETFSAPEAATCRSSPNDAQKPPPPGTDGAVALMPPVSSLDHCVGPEDACVTLVEYGDYECPACGQAEGAVASVCEAMGINLRFVFRHFPLKDIHPHAQRAAEAAECAGAQRRFWEMHQLLIARQNVLDNGSIVECADRLGLDIPQFLRDMKGHHYADQVQEDIASGEQCGVSGTPTFFINGTRYVGAGEYTELFSALQAALPRE